MLKSIGPLISPEFEDIERFAFYERTKTATAVLVTGETRPYGCFVVAKGVL